MEASQVSKQSSNRPPTSFLADSPNQPYHLVIEPGQRQVSKIRKVRKVKKVRKIKKARKIRKVRKIKMVRKIRKVRKVRIIRMIRVIRMVVPRCSFCSTDNLDKS